MRRLFAVFVLAAVVAMHGTPALGADAAVRGIVGDVTVSASSDTVGVHSLDRQGGAGRSAEAPAEPASPGHGVDSHVLAACLAILLAALTLLAAAAQLGRSGRPLRLGLPRRHFSAWTVPPRPPELSVLCLLRV